MAKNNVKTPVIDGAALLEKIKSEAKESIAVLEHQISAKQETRENLASEINDLENQIKALKEQKKQIDAEIAPIEEQIQDLKMIVDGPAVKQSRAGRKPSPVQVPEWLKPGMEFSANDVKEKNEVSQATANNFINKLMDAGMVTKVKHGVYVLNA